MLIKYFNNYKYDIFIENKSNFLPVYISKDVCLYICTKTSVRNIELEEKVLLREYWIISIFIWGAEEGYMYFFHLKPNDI